MNIIHSGHGKFVGNEAPFLFRTVFKPINILRNQNVDQLAKAGLNGILLGLINTQEL